MNLILGEGIIKLLSNIILGKPKLEREISKRIVVQILISALLISALLLNIIRALVLIAINSIT